ncbi:Uma2 family endonuclease [Actinomadura syzygii]|uniref:Uma2 family endonuclease n=1 Tax=Actinomadura syzygii TaxID=1427538 RepID=UPI00165253EE|nr:Uma2 family endonuclease [Actinomadura syzygii]
MDVAFDQGSLGPYTAEDLHAQADEGRGLELEDGWLIESARSPVHNFAYRRLHEFIEAAAVEAGASVYVDRGGDWEITTSAGIRKPDVFVVPRSVAQEWFRDDGPAVISGRDLQLVAEVVSPGSRSERTDRHRKLREYAAMNIPHYWIVDYAPRPRVRVFSLSDYETDPIGNKTGAYRLDRLVEATDTLEVEVQSDKPFTVRFEPRALVEF